MSYVARRLAGGGESRGRFSAPGRKPGPRARGAAARAGGPRGGGCGAAAPAPPASRRVWRRTAAASHLSAPVFAFQFFRPYTRRGGLVLDPGVVRARRRLARARPRRPGDADARARAALVGAEPRRGAHAPLDARRSGAAAGRSGSGGERARPAARHLPRHRAAAPPVDVVAAARTPRLGARRSIARDRDARPRAETGGNRARFAW